MAMGGKKRKFKASVSASKSNKKKPSYSKNYDPKKVAPTDSIAKDYTNVDDYSSGGSLAILDTVVRIYYQDLSDSVLNAHKFFIKSFIKRTGVKHISEISLTDFYAIEGYTSKSIKLDITNYITNSGVSKHRLFWRQNRKAKLPYSGEKSKKLIYMEIVFH